MKTENQKTTRKPKKPHDAPPAEMTTLHVDTTPLTPALLRFYHHLQKTHRDEIGSIPTPMLKKYADSQRLHTLFDAKTPLGYIIANDTSFHPAHTLYPRQIRIYVAVIDSEIHRLKYGTQLVHHVQHLFHPGPITTIGCWCATDIAATNFWKALGFTPQRARIGGLKRERMHTEYTRPIED